jgi:multidrug efflux pump subunit AcrB
MKLSDLSIQRPVLASMVSLALVLFGAIGYKLIQRAPARGGEESER